VLSGCRGWQYHRALIRPKSGEELRKELQEKTDEIITEVQKAADQRQQELEKEVKTPKA
jgi:gas vesicle protein